MPSIAGTAGQAMSASSTAAAAPCFRIAFARRMLIAVFPVPPLPPVTTRTTLAGFCTLELHSCWQVEQSCSQACRVSR